ncbi:MAG: rhomboid family intramembrane serine protease [Planctomycetes bacterium]|nr:rhomboid family intramembrane serine protease [Planctomycetota bacterium]
MIPFKDKNPSGTFPFVVIALIGLNGVFFIFEMFLGQRLEGFLLQYGIVPVKVVYFLRHPSLDPAAIKDTFLPFLSHMFLHGGVIHILGNMWYLWIFGDNIEDRLGHLKFLGFYIACGILASIVHVAMSSGVGLPCVGASGAIAGVLGAYMITFPKARVLCIIPIFFIWQIVELPAAVVLGFWFVIQFFSGVAAIAPTAPAGGVAWWAHIGGFVLGMGLMLVFPKRKPVTRPWQLQ